jgi:hypothetical protein
VFQVNGTTLAQFSNAEDVDIMLSDSIYKIQNIFSWTCVTVTDKNDTWSFIFIGRMARDKDKKGVSNGEFLATISENVSPYETVLSGQSHVNSSQRLVQFPPFKIPAISYKGAAAHRDIGDGQLLVSISGRCY